MTVFTLDAFAGSTMDPLGLFLERARLSPHEIALVTGSEALSYQELALRCTRVAGALRAKGVGTETVVGICLRRSSELVVASLAVLLAGGACLPLDPEYPNARLTQILEDAYPSLLIGEPRRLSSLASEGDAWSLVTLAELEEVAVVQQPGLTRHPESLAYLVYTSGSTGTPKGVALSYANLAGYCHAISQQLGLDEKDRYLHTASFGFVASIRPLLVPLSCGACVVLATYEELLDPERLWVRIAETAVTVLDVVASYLARLLETLQRFAGLHEAARNLRLVTFTGESLDGGLLLTWRRLLGESPRFLNLYGQTELTSSAAVLELALLDQERMYCDAVPVGAPIPGGGLYFLAQEPRLLEAATEGELLTAGPGLARGYLNQAALTAEKFLPNPFSNQPGARMFRTGDLGRANSDGSVALLGRLDDLIKIRGQRVEPGEVERVLGRLQGVAEAAVIAEKWRGVGEELEMRLLAFVRLQPESRLDASALMAQLAERLPRFMLPSSLGILEQLPHTMSGKLDRLALRALAARKQNEENERAVAGELTRDLESQVMAIWSAVLERGVTDPNRNFFELGGHSLLAARVANRVRSELGVTLELRDFFANPTPKQLSQLLEQRQQEAITPQETKPAEKEFGAWVGSKELSFAQERLWLIHRFYPEKPLYQIRVSFHLRGSLNEAAAEAAWRDVVRRHEPLHSLILAHAEEPRMVAEFSLEWRRAKNRGAEQEQALAESLRPYDLERDTPLRVLLTENETGWVMLVVVHHVAADGWSLGILVREWATCYARRSADALPNLSPLPTTYRAFAREERQALDPETEARLRAFWRAELADVPSQLDLPTDHARAERFAYEGAALEVRIPAELRARLMRLGHAQGATLFMSLLAAFQAWLSLYSGQEFFCVGSPIANRKRSEWETLVGCFVNLVPMRADLRENPSFKELLKATATLVPNALDHGDLPFERLVESLELARDPSRQPLCQIGFVLQNAAFEQPQIEGLALEWDVIDPGASLFDLALSLTEQADGSLRGLFKYNAALFDETRVEGMRKTLLLLWEKLAERPELRLSQLDLLTAAERQWLLEGLNPETQSTGPGLLRCFQEYAARNPERVAVVCEGRKVSYGELDQQSAVLAQLLREKGVGMNVPVGAYLTRTEDLVLAFLAIQKAGGFYLPLDPSYPEARIAWMCEDSAVSLVFHHALTQPPARLAHLDWLNLERLRGTFKQAQVVPLEPEPQAFQPAYAIYTSGSTGLPKGTLLTHAGLASLIDTLKTRMFIAEGCHVQQVIAMGFDASLMDFLMSLGCGGTLFCAGPGAQVLGEELEQVLRRNRSSHFCTTPALLEGLNPEKLPDMRAIYAGGELHARGLTARWAKYLKMFNVYGPTETTIWSTLSLCRSDDPQAPIGLPVLNTRIHVLDSRMRLVPPGVAGELMLAGPGLAVGYLARPDGTAARFIPDPFSDVGGRLYASGDLATRQADGQLRYLGRMDHQVKIRGFRIELGEIEQALCALEGVREAAVVTVAGGKELAAYLSLAEGTAFAALRRELSKRLPSYMLPRYWMRLEKLPRFHSRKLDRKSLPAYDPNSGLEARGEANQGERPASPIEAMLASLWARVLNLPRVGPFEDFFELGGHSILALRILSECKVVLGEAPSLQLFFEQPTVAQLAALLSGSPEQETQLERDPAAEAEDPSEGAGWVPLSAAQRRLWFACQRYPERGLFHMPALLRLRGALEPALLERALQKLAERHAALRAYFPLRAGEPVQAFLPAEALSLRYLDPDPDGMTAERAAFEAAAAEVRRPFALDQGPLLRALLIRVSNAEHFLLLTQHHLISDGWSLQLLFRDLERVYAALKIGDAEAWTQAAPDYKRRIRRLAATREAKQAELLNNWREALTGMPAFLELPQDRPRGKHANHEAGRLTFTLPPELGAKAQEFCRARSLTPFMFYFGIFQVLMARYSGQLDFCLGVPMGQRDSRDDFETMGFFVNMVPIRARLAATSRFDQLLTAVRRSLLACHRLRVFPFEELLRELDPNAESNRSALFQVVFTYLDAPIRPPKLEGLEVSDIRLDSGSITYDLVFELEENDSGGQGRIRYAQALFDEARMTRLAEQYLRLCTALLQDPQQVLTQIPLLSPEEWLPYAPLKLEKSHYERRLSIPALFARQVAQRPEAEAANESGRIWSYKQLAHYSDLLAARLIAAGIGLEARVGICAARTLERLAGFLAILKAGGIYVPIEMHLPKARRDFMLRDAGIQWLFVDESGALELADQGLKQLRLELEPVESSLASEAEALSVAQAKLLREREAALCADQGAYINYTSGSTGQPKAVLVTHANVARLAYAMPALELGATTRMLQLATTSFDAATFEIWCSLLRGGCCVLFPNETPSAANFAAFLAASRANTGFLTSSIFNALVDERAESLSGMRHLLVGGEALSRQHVAKALALVPNLLIYNGYGPTENTTFSTLHLLTSEETKSCTPIGLALDSSSAYVVDAGFMPVPTGVAGELMLGGEGLARGYLGRPDLTAERFVPNPFAGPENAGSRLYCSGDRVMRREDGYLLYLGRMDFQLKIRGFRIEPGEIEALLLAVPGVRAALVMAQTPQVPAQANEKLLVAYLVSDEEPETLRVRAHTHLKQHLQAQMIPSFYEVLTAFPLNRNGKVEREQLPLPTGLRAESSLSLSANRAPRTALETAIAELWSALFDRQELRHDANFFELGGHSVTAIRLSGRLSEMLRIQVPLGLVFEAPTVAELAAALERRLREQHGFQPPQLERHAPAGPAELSHAQERLWFIERLLGGSAVYNVPWTLRLRGPLDCERLEAALQAVVARHEPLHAVYREMEGLAKMLPDPDFRPIIQLRKRTLQQALIEARDEAMRPFALEQEPPLRAILWRVGADDQLLMLNLHHIATDGHSQELLLGEWARVYREGGNSASILKEKETTRLAEPRYADYALWQRSWLADGRLDRQRAYWKRQLADLPTLELQGDRVRPAIPSLRAGRIPLHLPQSLVEALTAHSQKARATNFMTLLAGLQILLARYSGQSDFAIGTPVINRPLPVLEKMIGFFANILVLRGQPESKLSFSQILAQTKAAALDAYENQDIPFEKLVEELVPSRDLSRHPLFQVSFSLLRTGETADWGALKAETLFVDSERCPFELQIALEPTEDGYRGGIRYALDLFDENRIACLAQHYVYLMEAALQEPERASGELPLEDRKLLKAADAAWNETRTDLPESTLVALFEAAAARHPARIAVAFGDQSLNYAELNRRANGMAERLIAAGVGFASPVAIQSSRSLEMLIGLLAILKAGGCYVPLDPDLPAERLAWIMADTGATLLLSDALSQTEAGVAAQSQRTWRVLSLVELAGCVSQRNPARRLHPEAPAYIIYTSGSTGKPKGVTVPQRAIRRLVVGDNYARLDANDVIAQASNAMFDAATFEIWGALLNGARLQMLAKESLLDPRLLGRALQGGISVLFVTTALFHQTASESPESFAPLRVLLFGGEMADPLAVRRVREALPKLRLLHVYGPTENTTFSTFYPVESVPQAARAVPIGLPLTNSQAHLADGCLHLQAPGLRGELLLGGEGLATGYWKRPDLTALHFIPDPFGAQPGARLYRTGDLARRSRDGRIWFEGRSDFQIKLRGFRIELGEIEQQLLAHPEVQEALVLLEQGGTDAARLVAYLAVASAAARQNDWRQYLAKSLPEYMLPALTLAMPALPRNRNGKIDRAALAGLSAAQPGQKSRPPKSAAERELAELWAQLLPGRETGATDHFFESGGHSLLATRLVSRIRERFGVELPLRSIFERPILADLALEIENLQLAEADDLEALLAELDALSEDDAHSLLG